MICLFAGLLVNPDMVLRQSILFLYIDSTEEVGRLFELELQKPRNLYTHESEECEDGEGVCYSVVVRYTLVIWSHKIRNKTWGGWTEKKKRT